MFKFLAVILALLALASSANASQNTVVVQAPAGSFKGYVEDSTNTNQFRGIPYATINGKRWTQSQFLKPFTDVYDAKEDGAACTQTCMLPPHTCPDFTSEECFFLNIFTPGKATPDSNFPVMVFFHGGNYKMGYGGGSLYNGSYIAHQSDVVVVGVNYRLGSFGFLADPAKNITGNFGYLDQVTSLKWVQQNIKYFGGNPKQVTIFGQSAGGGSVATHLTSPYSKDLFHAAIIHSNPFTVPFRTPETMPKILGALKKHANCSDTDCLLKLPTDDLLAAQNKAETDLDAVGNSLLQAFLPWTPYVDGTVLKYQPLEAFKRGAVMTVPLILGTTKDEAIIFIYQAFQKPMDALGYNIFANLIFGEERAKRVLERFPKPVSGGDDYREVLTQIGDGFIFHCANRHAARLFTQNNAPAWVYLFDHPMSFGAQAWGKEAEYCYDRTCHAGDLAFVWNSAQWLYPYTADEEDLAQSVVQYWTTFATTHTPNRNNATATSFDVNDIAAAVGLEKNMPRNAARQRSFARKIVNGGIHTPFWPVYSANTDQNIHLSTPAEGSTRAESGLYKDDCDFWDSIGYM